MSDSSQPHESSAYKTLQKKKSIDLNALQQNLPKTKH